jgi:branched-subunit amino acid aminotransferase/4-amino-4-deoxychorismate lyase
MDLAYLNGRLVPASEAVVPVYDSGFVLGATVAEQIRTFNGRLFRLPDHLARLAHSLEIIGVDPGVTMSELAEAAHDLVSRNYAAAQPGSDLGMSLFVTPGAYPAMLGTTDSAVSLAPRVCMHTYPLPFQLWAGSYRTGQSLVVSDVRQVPPACWPAELKCRSRMHYYLADQQARRREPGARALLLDDQGHVLEASTANILIYQHAEGLLSPPGEKILPGISMAVLTELADTLGIPHHRRELTVQDVLDADEAMLCSTSPCVWPVVRLDGRRIGSGAPGPTFRKLLEAWSRLVGLDIQAQAERFATHHASSEL